jgi:hypothetical protein
MPKRRTGPKTTRKVVLQAITIPRLMTMLKMFLRFIRPRRPRTLVLRMVRATLLRVLWVLVVKKLWSVADVLQARGKLTVCDVAAAVPVFI